MTEKSREKDPLKISIIEGVAYSIMEGMGLRNISAYALILGASNKIIGFLTSIPQLASALIQYFSLKILGEKISRKQISFWGAFTQALIWVFIISLALIYLKTSKNNNLIAPFLLVFFYTLLVAAGSIFAPAWSSWMKDLVDQKSLGQYFGKRNRIVGIASLSSMLLAGFLLDIFKKINPFIGFTVVFTIAMAARFMSAALLKQQHEPPFKSHKSYYFSLWDFIKLMPHSNFGRFTAFVNLFMFSVAVAGPFFAVYMLKHLGLSYSKFTLVSLASSSTSLLTVYYWGKLGDRYGNLKVLKITGFTIPLIPIIWASTALMNKNFVFYFLFFIEAFSGTLWAGFNISSSNFIYEAVTRQKIAICITYYNILNSFWVFVGATIGGYLASFNLIKALPAGNIIQVFILSGILRFFVALIILPSIKEVKKVDSLDLRKLKRKLLGPIDDLLFQISYKIRNPRG